MAIYCLPLKASARMFASCSLFFVPLGFHEMTALDRTKTRLIGSHKKITERDGQILLFIKTVHEPGKIEFRVLDVFVFVYFVGGEVLAILEQCELA